jgi:purine-binding chemotaxis protein CheW
MTRLPGAPEHVLGILNLRGALVTVIDIGLRLLGRASVSAEPSVIVLDVGGRLLGLLVDDVQEVLDLDSYTASHPDPTGTPGLVAGLGHFADAVVIVVDAGCLKRPPWSPSCEPFRSDL